MKNTFLIDTPLKIALKTVTAIAAAELMIMLILFGLGADHKIAPLALSLIDTVVVGLVASVAVFCWVVNPMNVFRERDKAAAMLRQAEEKYRGIFQNAVTGIYQTALDGRWLTANPTMAHILGYESPEEMIEALAHLTRDPYVLPQRREEFIRLIEDQGTVSEFESQVYRRDGNVIWISENARLLRDESGSLVGFEGTAIDITERKRAEEDLQQEHRLFSQGPVVLFRWRAQHGWPVEYVSSNVTTQFGYAVDDLTSGKIHYAGIVYPEDLERVAAEVKAFSESHTTQFRQEYRIIRADGEIRWVDDYTIVARNTEGEITHYDGYVVDSTERKRAEEALGESIALQKQVIASLPTISFITTDLNAIVTSFSSGAERIFGYGAAEMIGQPVSKLHVKEDAAKLPEIIRAQREGRIGFSGEMTLVRKNGEQFPAQFITAPILDSTGKVTALLGVSQDITERKRAEETALEQSKLAEAFFNHSVNCLVVLDREYNFLRVNEAYARACRRDIGEFVGRNHFEMYPSDAKHMFDEVVRTKRPFTTFARAFVFADQPERGVTYWDWTLVPILDKQGEVEYLVFSLMEVTERKQAGEAVRENEERMRTLIEASTDTVFFKDGEGRWLLINCAAAKLFDLQGKEYRGRTDLELREVVPFHRDALAYCYATDERTWQKKSLTRSEETIPQQNGPPRVFDVVKVPLFEEDGRRKALIVIGRDITERKRAEEELLKLKMAIDASGEAIFMTDRDGLISFVNPEFTSLYGYAADEVVGKTTPRILKSGQQPQQEYNDFWNTILNKQVLRREIVNRTKDGRLLTIESSVNPVLDVWGDIVAFLAVQRDITAHKQAEEKIREQASLLNVTQDAIFVCDLQDHIVYWNNGAERLYGWAAREVVGKKPNEYFFVDPAQFDHAKAHVFETGQWTGEFRQVRNDATHVVVESRWTMVREADGLPKSILVVNTDITEKKKIETQFIQAQRLESIGTLASGIAHDFNNILGIILGHASLLERNVNKPDSISRSSEAINKAVQRGAGVVKQLLTFARKTDVLVESIRINELVEELIQMLGEMFPKTIVLSMELDTMLPSMHADRNQVYQALLNLCVNARDAMPSGGGLSISTSTCSQETLRKRFPDADAEQYVSVSVTDTGTGMDQATLSRIFEPFFTTKGTGKGTGLGLAVLYGVVQSHKGFVDVESELDHGSTFRLYFPVERQRMELTDRHATESIEPPGGTETILLVEDEEMLLELVRAVLAGKGYTVLTASDGEEAVNLYERRRSDIALVLSDLGLPKLGGFEALKRLKQINPAVKVMMASGYIEPEQKVELLRAGARDFVQKPYQPNEILRKIREILDTV